MRDERESWTQNGRRREIPLPIEVESLRFLNTLAGPTVVTGDHCTMSSHSLTSKGKHTYTRQKNSLSQRQMTPVCTSRYTYSSPAECGK